jgi:hypothetical protein
MTAEILDVAEGEPRGMAAGVVEEAMRGLAVFVMAGGAGIGEGHRGLERRAPHFERIEYLALNELQVGSVARDFGGAAENGVAGVAVAVGSAGTERIGGKRVADEGGDVLVARRRNLVVHPAGEPGPVAKEIADRRGSEFFSDPGDYLLER